MGLQTYKQKRNFKKTPEPAGKVKKPASKLVFVVQRHKASHLHYDLRLEMEGTLKSWAVPKGPSMNPADKRLAMMVEDHPYEYRTFEGIIPEGNYGAGIVEIWDEGTLSDIDGSDTANAEKKLRAGLKSGNLKFRLNGKKLKGEFALVKIKGKEKDDNSWLLIKHRDEYALDNPYNSEELTPANSPINKWLAENGKGKKRNRASARQAVEHQPVKKKGVRRLPGETRKLDNFIPAMLARETEEPFSDSDWIYEIKWDGYRAIAEIDGTDVLLYSRNGNTFNQPYPVVVQALKNLGIKAVLDGEIVVTDDKGEPSFQLLQFYDSDPNHPILYYVFDVLSVNGTDTTDLPLVERKKLLKELLVPNETVRYSDHIESDGEAFFDVARKRGLEGVIAKKADSLYYPGSRTKEWLKIKNHKTQEAIIAGFTEPGGSRKFFGALILAVRDGKKLKYVGHTGTGFSQPSLKEMSERLKPLITKKSPFDEPVKTNTPVTWVKPVLVCEIKYTEFTRDGSMRHPVFLHLRDDKKPADVTLESMKAISVEEAESGTPPAPGKKKGRQKKAEPKTSKKTVVRATRKKPAKKNESSLLVDGIEVPVTNTDKVFWPEEGYTKGDVIGYYNRIGDYIMPYLVGRPQSLFRTPNGIDKPGFFHKDAGDEAPEWVESLPIFSESTDKDIDYILCNSKATLIYLANLGCIEINPWHSTVEALDNPDYLVIDIDPSKENSFDQVVETALAVKQVLDRAGADSFCKTSGATGLHVYIPTQKKYTYDQVKDFAQLVCLLTHELVPDFTSMERNLKKRGTDKIYLDHLQNRRGQTISCAYSLRPKKGATVSTPLEWKEVKKGLSPLQFTIKTIFKRLEKKGDLFTGVLGKGIDLVKCLENLGG